jgi:hypothetical protein
MSDYPKPVPPPKEGSNRGEEQGDEKRANISESISRRHPKGGEPGKAADEAAADDKQPPVKITCAGSPESTANGSGADLSQDAR